LTAKNSSEAAMQLVGDAIQIALINADLPDEECIQVIKNIKQDGRKVVVIVMMSGRDEDLVIKLLEEGADDFLQSPLDPADAVRACRDARLKYNFRSVHEQFQEKIDKLRSVTDYLDMVINYSQEAIFSCDVTGEVKIWNKGAEKMYGYTAEEILGRNVDEYLDPPDFKRKSADVCKILMQRGSFTEPEVPRRKKTGDIFPVTATYSSILNPQGEFIGFSVVERDVTPVRALEAEKIKSARLRAITQTAVTANDHINTPLGIILGYSQFLQMKLADLSAEDTVALETIQQQVHKIKGIMNKLKLMSDPIVKNYSIEGVTMLDLNRSK
jgi:PAS domain S-box-containing protein